jgi:glycolate oxidase iron-sulfur subunit
MDIFYNDVNHATISLLTKTKKIVKVGEQTCCGALAYHAGETDIARDLAKKNIDFFENQSGEIVVNAAGCGAMLKHYPELLKDDPEFHERAEDFAGRVKDFTEYLDKENWSPDYIENKDSTANKTKLKVAYHAACHLCHAQAIRKEPEQLLDKCTNIETKPLEDKELCCGSAGIFNITHPELSFQVLADKMKRIAETDANVIVTTNPGCMIQLEYGAKASGLNIKVRHLASLLDEQDSST